MSDDWKAGDLALRVPVDQITCAYHRARALGGCQPRTTAGVIYEVLVANPGPFPQCMAPYGLRLSGVDTQSGLGTCSGGFRKIQPYQERFADQRMSDGLTFAILRAANLSRCGRWHPRGLNEWSLSDWFTATMGELGEAANIAKKLNRYRDGIAGNVLTEQELRAELADEIADLKTKDAS